MHRLQSQSTGYKTALDSLQTLTGTKTRLHVFATVGHRIGPGSIQKFVRLRTILVVGVAREETLCKGMEVVMPGSPSVVVCSENY